MENYQPEDARRDHPGSGEDWDDSRDGSEDLLFLGDDEQTRRFDLISAYLDGEVTSSERHEVQCWLDTDPEAKKLYHRLRVLQAHFQQIPIPATAPADRLAEKVFQKVDRQRKRRFFLYGGALVATMAIALISHGFGRQDSVPQMASHPSGVSPEGDSLMIALNHPILDMPSAENKSPQ
jgi:anti-sigma factor RsiW